MALDVQLGRMCAESDGVLYAVSEAVCMCMESDGVVWILCWGDGLDFGIGGWIRKYICKELQIKFGNTNIDIIFVNNYKQILIQYDNN